MATAGNSKFSSDQLDERKSACFSENGINSRAKHYCVDCELYFCSKCVQCHNTIPSLKSHQLNDVDVSNWTTESDIETKEVGPACKKIIKCSVHEDRPIDTYCKDHDEICCETCAVLKHRSCQTTSVSIAAKDFHSNPEVKECREKLKTALITFKQEKAKRTKNIDSIGKQKIELIGTIDKYEEKLIAKIKKLANNTRNEICSKYEKHRKVLEKDVRAMDAAITSTAAYVDKLEQTDDELLFVNIKKSKMVIEDYEKLIQAIGKDLCERELRLYLNKTLDTTIDGMETLGRLEDGFTIPGYKSTLQRNSNLPGNVTTNVFDMCFIDSGDLLLADHNRQSLKRVNSELNYKDEIELPGLPIALSAIEKHEVAVRMWSTGEVHIVSLGETMQLKSKFILNGNGYGMTYDAGEIFACEVDKVNVYSKTGEHLRTYDRDTNGEQMFSACRQIAISSNKDIYVTEVSKGLFILDKTGHLKMKINSFDYSDVWYLFLLPGHVCVVGSSAGKFCQIDKDGKQVDKQIVQHDRNINTYCATFDHENSRLLIACSDFISIYTLQPNEI